MTKGKHGTGGWGCDGCHQPPWDHTLPGPLDSETLHEWQAFCCGCIPNCIEVLLNCGAETSRAVFCRECSFVIDSPVLWAGVIPIGDTQVDLQFLFVVRNERCYICLRSTALDIVGDPAIEGCYEITTEQRAAPTYFCWTLKMDDGYGAEAVKWLNGQLPYCPNLEITIRPDDSSPIYPRFDCIDSNGIIVPDTDPIRGVCGGCSCICDCFCIITQGVGLAHSDIVCRDGAVWRTADPDPVAIELQANYETGCCELVLTAIGQLDPHEGTPVPILIGEANENNPCPHPTANWTWTGTDASPQGVHVHCAQDGQCPEVVVVRCCDAMLPLILNAEIDAGPYCECGNTSCSLVYNTTIGNWIGWAVFCNGLIKLELACSGEGIWQLIISENVCTFDNPAMEGGCLPLDLVFESTGGGVGCCNDFSIGGGPYSITIHITE